MPIAQILLASGNSATPTYTLTPFFSGGPESVNEGSGLNFLVGGTNIVDGTYYWTIETNAGDFATASGTVSVTGTSGANLGVFGVTPTADATTEATAETFTVALREGSITGTILVTSAAVTINDTSLTPVAPFSLEFNQPQQDYLSTPASADWNLGTSWTIEFWLNANSSGYSGNPNMNGDIWGLVNQTGWGATNSINIAISDAKLVVGQGGQYADVRYTEPTPAQWTHVAISNDAGTQRVFYNGVEQTKVSGTFGTANYANSTDSLAIGTMSGGNNYFDGKMALVRISNTAKYLTAFTATTTYGVEADTELFLSSDTPLVDSKSHTITNNGVTTTTDVPQSFTGHLNPYSGGNLSATYSLFEDPNITAFSAIPVGARITSNLSGFGIRLVTGIADFYGGRMITYDNTGLPGGTVSTTSDVYNFYW